MAKKKESGSGLMSSAGLMRYHDADESAMRVSPRTVIMVGVITGLAAIVLGLQFGTWPS